MEEQVVAVVAAIQLLKVQVVVVDIPEQELVEVVLDGAGGTCCAGGGGYTGGSGDSCDIKSNNGNAGYDLGNEKLAGGGYLSGANGIDKNSIDRANVMFGGAFNQGSYEDLTHKSGSGGTAGKGGNVKVSDNSKIYAYNGNIYSDGTDYENGFNQCPIYLQCRNNTCTLRIFCIYWFKLVCWNIVYFKSS